MIGLLILTSLLPKPNGFLDQAELIGNEVTVPECQHMDDHHGNTILRLGNVNDSPTGWLDVLIEANHMPDVTMDGMARLLLPDYRQHLVRIQTRAGLRERSAEIQAVYSRSGIIGRSNIAIRPNRVLSKLPGHSPTLEREWTYDEEVWVYATEGEAESKFHKLRNPGQPLATQVQDSAPRTPGRLLGQLPSGIALGSEHFTWSKSNTGPVAPSWSRIGRVVFRMVNTQPEQTEAYMRGIQYRILQQPQLSLERHASTSVSIRGVRILTTVMNGVSMVRLAEFRKLGANVRYLQREEEAVGELGFGSRTVSITPYSFGMTVNGVARRMQLPSIVFEGDLVVPLKSVGKALGIIS